MTVPETERRRRRYRQWVLGTAVIVFALVFVLRLADPKVDDAVVLLYTVPIALIAAEFGRTAGLSAAGLGFGLFLLYALADGTAIGPVGYASRAIAFLVLGGVLGEYADRQRRVLAEREDLERERRAAEAAAARFFEMGHDMFATASFDGYFTRLNDAWEQALGYSPRELMTQPYVELIHPDDVEATFAAAGSLSAGDSEVVGFENRYRAKDGSWRWLQWAARSDREQVYAVAKDVTESKAMEQELMRSNAELEQFAYVASHDLAEPLRSITGFSQLLQKRHGEKLDGEAHEFLSFIVDGTERMRELIDGLLSYSRVGRAEIDRESVDCQLVMRRTIDSLRASIEEKQASFSAENLPTVSGDATLIQRLFQNLLANALKFTNGEAPRVVVTAGERSGFWCFTVRDNGIGIEPQYAERVFGMFQRLHGRESYPGTGIGLAVCKRIVERHGGSIWVEPGEAGGSAFHFTLPGVKTSR